MYVQVIINDLQIIIALSVLVHTHTYKNYKKSML